MKMKASMTPVRILLLAALLIPLMSGNLSAKDATIILTSGQERKGEILSVEGTRVNFKSGPATSSLPLKQIQAVEMDAPADYTKAVEAWTAGQPEQALKLLEPLVNKFRGLPSEWTKQASAQLGDLFLVNGQMEKAKAAFTAFQRAYPDAKELTTVGLARLALERGEPGVAKIQIKPVLDKATGMVAPADGQGPGFAQACYIMGRALEADQQLPDALKHYLLVETVYYQDPTILKLAQERAQALIDQGVVVP